MLKSACMKKATKLANSENENCRSNTPLHGFHVLASFQKNWENENDTDES